MRVSPLGESQSGGHPTWGCQGGSPNLLKCQGCGLPHLEGVSEQGGVLPSPAEVSGCVRCFQVPPTMDTLATETPTPATETLATEAPPLAMETLTTETLSSSMETLATETPFLANLGANGVFQPIGGCQGWGLLLLGKSLSPQAWRPPSPCPQLWRNPILSIVYQAPCPHKVLLPPLPATESPTFPLPHQSGAIPQPATQLS